MNGQRQLKERESKLLLQEQVWQQIFRECVQHFSLAGYWYPNFRKESGGYGRSLYSIVQMPPGIPVATVAIDGAKNAAILAAKILATSDAELLEKLKAYTAEMKETVQAKAAKLDALDMRHIWHQNNRYKIKINNEYKGDGYGLQEKQVWILKQVTNQ